MIRNIYCVHLLLERCAKAHILSQKFVEDTKVATSLIRRVGAEALGTFALVTAGCGAVVVDSQTHSITHLGVALSFGLIIMVMIAATSHLSGAHFNPAVTVALATTRHFPWNEVLHYIGGQLVGASAGALVLRLLFGNVALLGTAMPRGSAWQSCVLEALLTGVLMFVIIAVTTDARANGQLAAVAIGATVALDVLWGGPITGGSMNPARSLGPALLSGAWQDQWVYVVGPLVGAVLGALLYQWLYQPMPKVAEIMPTVATMTKKVASRRR